jgi:CheY-like chemotaxis protein
MLQSEIMMEKGPQPIPALGRKSQLRVVHDNEAVRDVLSRALSAWGCDVTLAGNGIEAGKLFFTGSYDLVITDLEMPFLNGWELARLIKERSPSTPVVVVSGSCDETLWEKKNMRCVDSMIMKPFKLKDIEGTVRRLLNSGI